MTSVVFRTAALLVCSNVFMTFAWYAAVCGAGT